MMKCRPYGKVVARPYSLLLATLAYSLVVVLMYAIYVFRRSEVVSNSTGASLQSDFYKWPQFSITRNVFQEFKHALGLGGEVTSARHGVRFDVVHEGYRDMTHQPLKLSCSRCAIVTSSGHLLNSSAGAEIDSHPCIFRMNNAPTLGYERDVGSRTTVRSIGHVNLIKSFEKSSDRRQEIFGDNRTRTEIVLINWMAQLTAVDVYSDPDYRYALLLAHLYPDIQFYHFTPEKMNRTQDLFKNETGIYSYEANTWLSTGWFTMVAAMDICDEITVYGMAHGDYCYDNSTSDIKKDISYHYYEPGLLKECKYYNESETRLRSGHLFITEKAVFEKWAIEKKNIKFRYPKWTLSNSSTSLDTPFLNIFWSFVKDGGNMTDLLVRKTPRRKVVRKKVIKKKTSVIMTLQKGNQTMKINQDELVDFLMQMLPDVKLIQTDEYNEGTNKTIKVDDPCKKKKRPVRKVKKTKKILAEPPPPAPPQLPAPEVAGDQKVVEVHKDDGDRNTSGNRDSGNNNKQKEAGDHKEEDTFKDGDNKDTSGNRDAGNSNKQKEAGDQKEEDTLKDGDNGDTLGNRGLRNNNNPVEQS